MSSEEENSVEYFRCMFQTMHLEDNSPISRLRKILGVRVFTIWDMVNFKLKNKRIDKKIKVTLILKALTNSTLNLCLLLNKKT